MSAAQAALQWTPDRAKRALTSLAQDGMAWIDSATTTSTTTNSTAEVSLIYNNTIYLQYKY